MMETKILCYGDSNTFGYDARSPWGERLDTNERWTGILKQQGFPIVNFGENGRCLPATSIGYKVLDNVLDQSAFSSVVILLGSNDLLNLSSLDVIAEKLKTLLRHLLQDIHFAPEQILLLAPVKVQLGAWIGTGPDAQQFLTLSEQLVTLYSDIASEYKIRFADPNTWDIELTYDGVHFSVSGHRRFAEMLKPLLNHE